MKSLRKLLYIIPLTGMMVTSCMDVENIEIDHIGGYATMNNAESEAYYANLRAYKATAWNYNRPVAFGWYSNWAPAGAYRRGYLSAMPDSMDFVSMWSGAPGRYEITPEQKADKEFVQKVKGTKLLQVSLLSYLGKGATPNSVYLEVEKQAEEEGWSAAQLETAKKQARWKYWGFEGQFESENHYACLAKFAKALCDSLYANEWDGYDVDWEELGNAELPVGIVRIGQEGNVLHMLTGSLLRKETEFLWGRGEKETEVRMAITDGDSGSAVFDENGKLVSMIFGCSQDAGGERDWGVPLRAIVSCYEKITGET